MMKKSIVSMFIFVLMSTASQASDCCDGLALSCPQGVLSGTFSGGKAESDVDPWGVPSIRPFVTNNVEEANGAYWMVNLTGKIYKVLGLVFDRRARLFLERNYDWWPLARELTIKDLPLEVWLLGNLHPLDEEKIMVDYADTVLLKSANYGWVEVFPIPFN